MSGYRPSYTLDEESSILEAIVATKSFMKLRSKVFWIDMETAEITSRTWQSMKERFEKFILPRIDNEDYKIEQADKRLIQLGYEQSRAGFQPKKKFCKVGDDDDEEDSSS